MSAHKNNTETFYRDIIQKVCEAVKEDFLNEGISEDVISELRKVDFAYLDMVWQTCPKWDIPASESSSQFCKNILIQYIKQHIGGHNLMVDHRYNPYTLNVYYFNPAEYDQRF
mgnify:CR=1 FL=1